MSCQVNLGALIINPDSIRNYLFSEDEQKGSDTWLQLCEISVSPSGDIVVLSYGTKIVVLSAEWNDNSCPINYHIAISDRLGDEEITSVLCLPVVRQSSNAHLIDIEWTCIAVGFQSGYLRFYTEDLKLLLSEQFHSESICSVKCQSQHSSRPDINFELRIEELYVQYLTNVCVIGCNHLFNILRNHRSQLIRGDFSFTSNDSSSISVKKWGFVDQFAVNDSEVVGLQLSNTFDHLLTASTCGGFDTKYRSMAPSNTLVLGVGNKPFLGFHFAVEGGSQPLFTDVAKAIATKVKSALPVWLTGSKIQADKLQTLASQPAEPIGCRFGICDLRRNGIEVVLSQNRRLAVVTDVLGRVCLLDIHQGIVIRMFKGYREAQCAFIQVPDERRSRQKSKNRIATFLIIYCPKKGTLEILSVQTGIKIAVFTASKFSRLLYTTYGLMGFTTVSKSKYVCRFTCVLIDSDGKIKEIIVPFHFALPEKNSRRSRDIHLYKRLKQFIKTKSYNNDQLLAECLNTCKELKTVPIQLQCLEMLSSGKEIDFKVILECSEYFVQKYKTTTTEEFDSEQKHLKKFAENLKSLSQFYEFITKSADKESEQSSSSTHQQESVKKKKKIFEHSDMEFLIGKKELDSLQRLLDLSIMNIHQKKTEVTFSFDKDFTFSQYLSIFELTSLDQITVKVEAEESLIFSSAEIIFQKFVEGRRDDFEDFKLNIINSNISIKDLVRLLIFYWVNRLLTISMNLENEMQNLNKVVYGIVKTANSEDVAVEYNQVSKFWSEVREILGNSEKSFPALTAALICRSVFLAVENEKEKSNQEEENVEIWEKFSQENCEWMLLIGKLEDVSLLSIILSNKPNIKDNSLCILPKLKQEDIHVSLKNILEKKGSVSELVCQWLTTSGINPEIFIKKDSTEDEVQSEEENDDKEIEPFLVNLNLIKQQFPYSTDASILLTNMCWEYALFWQKNLQDFSLLEACIKCLNLIPNVHLKQGLYNLVWNTHLKIIFESACKLVNKVGKMPKEKLCRQDTGLSDKQMVNFLQTCTDFLDSFLEIIQQCYNSERNSLQYEPIWDENLMGQQTLCELALQQTHINYDLVHLHYQLSMVILMQSVFNVKHSKTVTNLFDNTMSSLFFTDFQHKVQISWHKSETKVLASRTQFLLKVISANVEMLPVSDKGVGISSENHARWMGKILNLSRVWSLDVDVLKRFQVIQLYVNGHDSTAEELLSAVSELDKLGPDLINIGAKRLSKYLTSSKDLAEKICSLSPALTQYLENLNGDWCAPCSLEQITNILINSLHFMPAEQKEYKIGSQLLEACISLQNISE